MSTGSQLDDDAMRHSVEREVSGLGIGTRVRHARLSRTMRLKDIAAAAECSESLISKIENNKIQPSLRVLHRICRALDITIGELFAPSQDDGGVVKRQGERQTVELDSFRRGRGVRMERLIPYAQGHLLQGNIHIIAPGGSSEGFLSHRGEEVGYVISGELELHLGEESFLIREGDSFFYQSERPHAYRNPGRTETRVLFVNTPPTF